MTIAWGLDDLCDWLEEYRFQPVTPIAKHVLAAYRLGKWLVELVQFAHGIGAVLHNSDAEPHCSSILYANLDNLLADVQKFDADPSEWDRQFIF